MTGRFLIATVALGALLSACASPQQQQRARQANMAERVLERAGSIGDPGKVAAADFAFARAAQEDGQWTAFRRYAAPGAVLHGRNGPVPVTSFLSGMDDPSEAVEWAPNTVWSSCDGTLAISFGRFEDTEGLVGSYVSAWALQRDGSYKYTYDLGAPDNPQPVRDPEGEAPDDAIVVEGLRSVQGRIADCPRRGEIIPLPPLRIVDGARQETAMSDDKTLAWTWYHTDQGVRSVNVQWYRGGEWQDAVNFAAPPLAG
ncbi:hypothetical protein [Aurantiacibacter aquimixticola]|uniref:Lipoprotein n=1 Tax=Aurantiacibacter aquimixticola TaxID=1958945 RepID=A0A419RU83_9SPHN|nr:hypothetical protein [Aurantiacibacter aquimixticola]RJY09345.1 hypothetical protein D6201_08240 [Aurantiacibacter aquimixticola]